MILRLLAIVGLILAFAGPVAAAPVSVVVTGADGRPLPGAVVTVTVPGTPAALPSPASKGSYVMAQRNIAFDPHVLIVPVGATVAFPNRDQVRHHAYSFSPAKRFELKLYGRDETKSVTFDRAGVVAIGCNIHDGMSAFVFVTTTPYAAISDAAGHVLLDVPAGRATLAVWHPSIRAAGNSVSRIETIVPTGLTTRIGAGG